MANCIYNTSTLQKKQLSCLLYTSGMAVMPKKKNMKSVTGKALKTAGEIVENISDAIGL